MYFCCFQASFEDSQNTLQLQRSYTSPSHYYLQIQKPSTPAQVNLKNMKYNAVNVGKV